MRRVKQTGRVGGREGSIREERDRRGGRGKELGCGEEGEANERSPKEGNTTPSKLSQAVVLSWTGKHFQIPTNGRHRVLE